MRASLRFFAVLAAVLLLCTSCTSVPRGPLSASSGDLPVDTGDASGDLQSVPADNTVYAADSFFCEDGALDTASTENLTIGFIGGSLTEGAISYDENLDPHSTNGWTDRVLAYFSETFPTRYIRAYNAGISATTSDFGAVRIGRCILQYAPDVLFIEYAVNDSGWGREKAQAYMEAMVTQARALPKVPAIIFVYNPQPSDPTSAAYTTWRTGVDYKEELAAYYGIGTVNVYDYLYADFRSGGYGSFFAYLGQYFNLYESESGGYYDVHPRANGYAMYGEAVVTAIAGDPARYLCRMKRVSAGFEDGAYDAITGARYHHIAPDSERLTYTGSWSFYDRYTPFNEYATAYSGIAIPVASYEAPFNEDGIAQTLAGGASVSFFSAAAGLYVQIPYAACGKSASVYIDGRYTATVSCHKDFYGYSGVVFVPMPDDGAEHAVQLVAGAVSAEYAAFRFGYIIEQFPGK